MNPVLGNWLTELVVPLDTRCVKVVSGAVLDDSGSFPGEFPVCPGEVKDESSCGGGGLETGWRLMITVPDAVTVATMAPVLSETTHTN